MWTRLTKEPEILRSQLKTDFINSKATEGAQFISAVSKMCVIDVHRLGNKYFKCNTNHPYQQ